MNKERTWLLRLLFVGGILLLLGISWRLFGSRWDHFSVIRLGYVGVFLAVLASSSTLFLPGPALVIPFAASAWLNPVLLVAVAAAGGALGETTGYATGVASRVVLPHKTKWYMRIRQWMHHYAFITIFLLAAIPNPLTDLSGIIAGRIQYSFWKFLLSTFLGKLVRFALVVLAGIWVFH